MEVYCTRPGCKKPINSISDEDITRRSVAEIRCSSCGMPLISQGHFVATELLGSGGFGRTFKAKDLDFRFTTRVIKQLLPKVPAGQVINPSNIRKIEKMFEEEAITLDRLQHPRIPKFLAFFTLALEEETGYMHNFFYLVQDYIEGQNLAQELQQKGKFSEDEVINVLKELLNILKYIHNHDGNNKFIYIHRDIKPANIIRCSQDGKLYLIDFGAVKQILEGLEVETTSIVLDRCFAPPEQFRGQKLSPASDLYATAATCLSLLTGNINPNELLEESDIKQIVKLSDQRFAKALDWMLKSRPRDRPQSAQEILDILDGKKQPGVKKLINLSQNSFDRLKRILRRWRWIRLGILAFLGVAIAVAAIPKIIGHIQIRTSTQNISAPQIATSPTSSTDSQYFSRGEDELISVAPECTSAYSYKRQGIESFANKEFTQAENYFNQAKLRFKQAAQTTKCEVDPETVIYEYNAKLAQNPSNLSLPTIAVVIPGYSINRDIALEILRGVAQSLDANTPLFQILIAKENIDNNQINTEKVARYLAQNNIPGDSNFQQSQILGVIGHYTSINTWKAGDIYGATQLSIPEKLVLISPTSTAIRIPNILDPSKNLNPYVFRTASNDAIAASDLAKYMWETLALRKTMIVYDPSDRYSDSLRREFNNYLIRNGVNHNNHIQYCNLITELPEICIQKAKITQAKALLLFASRDALDREMEIIKLANQEFTMLGGDILYDQKTLSLKESANDMIVAVFSHINNANPQFIQKAEEIGWRKDITWRSISSYDAAQVFTQALTELSSNSTKTRQDIYNKLKDTNFSASGATSAKVSFQADGDRQLVTGVGVLVQVTKISGDEYGFTLLNTPERQ
ncbi:MAG TPA: protein kinase [Trichormus sp. M33_DOE_039]|nr:protein kinase [Trichormus sp. M33_DOE_039]